MALDPSILFTSLEEKISILHVLITQMLVFYVFFFPLLKTANTICCQDRVTCISMASIKVIPERATDAALVTDFTPMPPLLISNSAPTQPPLPFQVANHIFRFEFVCKSFKCVIHLNEIRL